MAEKMASPRAEDIFGMMDSGGTGTINLADFKKAFPQLMQTLSPSQTSIPVSPAHSGTRNLPKFDLTAKDIFSCAFRDSATTRILFYTPGSCVSFDEPERQQLLRLLAANTPILPSRYSASEHPGPAAGQVAVGTEQTHCSKGISCSGNGAEEAAVADVGAQEIFARCFSADQEECLLVGAPDDFLHWAAISAADLGKDHRDHAPDSFQMRRSPRNFRQRLSPKSEHCKRESFMPTAARRHVTESEMQSLMQQHKAGDMKRRALIDSIRTRVSPKRE